ncbi:MAG: flagellin lysine-N-methylase [Eubacterium sp.]|nr:flagellin lysine-N-methylase [Eubacterium sp.]
MKERYPTYYEKFKCIADKCEDTCCAGWEIDIDDDSYAGYMKIGGELGDRLRSCIKTNDEEGYAGHGFILTGGMRCPFLDKDNLCELYRELGESSLCEVCANTPRNFLEYGGVREISLSASCPEAARLIYGSPEPMAFTEHESDETSQFDADDIDDEMLARFLVRQRAISINILQDRDRTLTERADRFLDHAREVQDALNKWETNEKQSEHDSSAQMFDITDMYSDRMTDTGFNQTPAAGTGTVTDENEFYRGFLTRMELYSGLASIGQAWADRITLMYESFVKEPANGKADYIRAVRGLTDYMDGEGRLYEYEHLMVYYAFLLLNRSIDDYDYLTKARLVVMSYEMNRDMDAAIWFKNGCFLKKDREENARIYAREVEHAEENLADLYEELLFS